MDCDFVSTSMVCDFVRTSMVCDFVKYKTLKEMRTQAGDKGALKFQIRSLRKMLERKINWWTYRQLDYVGSQFGDPNNFDRPHNI